MGIYPDCGFPFCGYPDCGMPECVGFGDGGVVPPPFSFVLADDGTLEMIGNDGREFTVDDDLDRYDGTYTVTVPVPVGGEFLKSPVLGDDGSPAVGETLTIIPALLAYDDENGALSVSYVTNGTNAVDTTDPDNPTLLVDEADAGVSLNVTQQGTQGGTTVSEISNSVDIPGGVARTVVFALGGQSNMVGRDNYDGLGEYPVGTLQYNQFNVLEAVTTTLDHLDESAGSMGLTISFANAWIAANPLDTIVFVPRAEGGTGFVDNEWNPPSDPRYAALVADVNQCLSENPDFVYMGLLWHQGEKDGGEFDYLENQDAALLAFHQDITGATATSPIVVGGWAQTWNPDTHITYQTIEDTPNRLAYVAFASSGDPIVPSIPGDDIHFSAAGLRTMGDRYFASYADAVANVPPIPDLTDVEAGALTHCLFGSDDRWMRNLVDGVQLTRQRSYIPSLSANAMTPQTAQSVGLLTDVTETIDMTTCCVISPVFESIIFGTLTTSGDGSNGGSLYITSSGNLIHNERDGAGSTNLGTITLGTPVFLALSVSAAGNITIYRSDGANSIQTGESRNPSTKLVAVGNGYYNNSSYATGNNNHEFILFNTFKTEAELDDIYARSQARMSARGIVI